MSFTLQNIEYQGHGFIPARLVEAGEPRAPATCCTGYVVTREANGFALWMMVSEREGTVESLVAFYAFSNRNQIIEIACQRVFELRAEHMCKGWNVLGEKRGK